MSQGADNRAERRRGSRLERASAARRVVERVLRGADEGVLVDQWRQPRPMPRSDGRVIVSLRLIVDSDAVDREVDRDPSRGRP